jgi:hypothetical protein
VKLSMEMQSKASYGELSTKLVDQTGGQSDTKIKTAHEAWAALLQTIRCVLKN